MGFEACGGPKESSTLSPSQPLEVGSWELSQDEGSVASRDESSFPKMGSCFCRSLMSTTSTALVSMAMGVCASAILVD